MFEFRSRGPRRLPLAWLLVFIAPASFAQPLTRPELAEVGAPVTPETFFLDLRSLPTVHIDATGSPPRDLEDEQELERPTWARESARNVSPTRDIDATQPAPRAFGDMIVNAAGQNYTNVLPADPTGDVSELHYVQAVNAIGSSVYSVFSKVDGSRLAGPISLASVGSPVCSDGFSDPQVIYDVLAQRWLLAEIASIPANTLCVYVSADANILSTTWHRYAFTLANFPDYPKFAVWDSAYALGYNGAGGAAADDNSARSFYVFDRAAMLAGAPATFQRFHTGSLVNTFFGFGLALPVGLKGNNPPMPNAPVNFVVVRDDEFDPGGGTFGQDQLLLYTVAPDFAVPANSVATGPTIIATGEVSFNGGVALQSNGRPLPMFTGVPMHRATYRNFGDREVMVMANTYTDIQDSTLGSLSAIHWLELRRTGGAAQPWTVAQDGYFAPGGTAAQFINRFIPGVQMDNSGNMALAYGVMRNNPAIHPGLRYTGRVAGDLAGTMPIAETVIADGAEDHNFGTNPERWGDYFDMTLDPDGCRFWFTGGYMDDATWGTRIAAWRHDSCAQPDFTMNSAQSAFEVCTASGAQTLGPVSVALQGMNSFWSDVSLSLSNASIGISGGVNPNLVRPPGSTQVTINVGTGTAPGANTVDLSGQAGTLTHTRAFAIDVANLLPAGPTGTTPAQGATNVVLLPQFVWPASAQADTYTLEASTTSNFATLVFTQTTANTFYTPINLLPANTQIFWRVRANNQCGNGAFGATRSFTTIAQFCRTPAATPVPDNGFVEHTISISGVTGTVSDLDAMAVVNNIRRSGVRLELTNLPANRTITLLDPLPAASCAGTTVNAVFDDASALAIDCANVNATPRIPIRPTQALANFNGLPLNGDWRIRVTDTTAGDGTGQFITWCLQPQGIETGPMFSDGFE
jgi:hypothetical protein